jgi:RNA polymerase sigma-70 factor (ECF subfamily)
VARALPRFDLGREGATFRGWLYTVVRNKLRDRARDLSSTPLPEGGTDARMRIEALPESESEESRSDGEAGEAAALRRALAELRGEFVERTCRMFWETAIAGRSPREVAGELGVTVDAVYQAKSRIARRLRELLANLA